MAAPMAEVTIRASLLFGALVTSTAERLFNHCSGTLREQFSPIRARRILQNFRRDLFKKLKNNIKTTNKILLLNN